MEGAKGDAADNYIHHTWFAMQINPIATLSVYLLNKVLG
jgi:hypothetical protein